MSTTLFIFLSPFAHINISETQSYTVTSFSVVDNASPHQIFLLLVYLICDSNLTCYYIYPLMEGIFHSCTGTLST